MVPQKDTLTHQLDRMGSLLRHHCKPPSLTGPTQCLASILGLPRPAGTSPDSHLHCLVLMPSKDTVPGASVALHLPWCCKPLVTTTSSSPLLPASEHH